MNLLNQKYHGLPGVGVNGIQGLKGASGNNVYFGHINDFFNMVGIEMSKYVKLGVRDVSIETMTEYATENKSYIEILDGVLKTEITDAAGNVDAAHYKLDQADASVLSTQVHRYYTGGYKANTTVEWWVDYDNNVLLIQSMLSKDDDLSILDNISSYVATPLDNANVDIYNDNNKGKVQYNKVYKHEVDKETKLHYLGEWENAVYVNVASYEYEQAARILNFDLYDYTDNNQYTALDSSLEPTTLNGSMHAYLKERLRDGSIYALDTSTYYGNVQFGLNGTITTTSDGVGTFNINNNVNTSLFAKSAVEIIKQEGSVLFNVDNIEYYGLSDQIVYENGNVRPFESIWNDVSMLSPFSDNKAETEKYVEVLNTIYTPAQKNYIQWTSNSISTYVPTYLNTDKYKAGDTIYFYTTTPIEGEDVQLIYRITLTDDMRLDIMDTDTFIASAQLTDPFEVKYIDVYNRRVVSNFSSNVFHQHDSSLDSSGKFSNQAMLGVINSFTDNALMLATKDDCTFISCATDDTGEKRALSIDSSVADSIESVALSADNVRFSSLYLNANNIYDTIELKSKLDEKDIIKTDGYIQSITDIDLNYINNEYAFSKNIQIEDYFSNIEDDCYIGYEVYKNGILMSNNMSNENMQLVIAAQKQNTYDIFVFAYKSSGIKYYSKCSRLVLDENGEYSLEVIGDDSGFQKPTENGKIKFTVGEITSEQNSNVILSLSSEYQNINIKSVRFNNKTIGGSASWSNSWAQATKTDISTYVINTSSNLPNLLGEDPTTIAQYMSIGADSGIDPNQSDIFTMLMSGESLPSTKQRFIRVTVEYDEGDGESKYENYNIIQPGFTDYRDVPNIKLTLHNQMNDLEKYNTIDNGVMCNQFRTYLEIDVEDFYEKWGRQLPVDCSVQLNFTVKNIATDIKWRQKYTCVDKKIRTTLKTAITDQSMNPLLAGADTTPEYRNYIKLTHCPISPEANIDTLRYSDISIYDDAHIELDSSLYIINNDSSLNLINQNSLIDASDGLNSKYICFTDDIVKAMQSVNYINNGIYDSIEIKLKNLDFDLVKDNTYKVAVNFEMGNPELSNLFLQFAVTDVSICLNTSAGSTTFNAVAPLTESAQNINSYLYSLKNGYKEKYTFASEPLDVYFNPLSYICCADEDEKSIGNISLATIKKRGSLKQLTSRLQFYASNLYKNSALMNEKAEDAITDYVKGWGDSKLKIEQFQDNVSAISVYPIDPKDIVDALPESYKQYQGSVFEHDTIDEYGDTPYLSVVYNSSILTPRSYNGIQSFIYNEQTYRADKYGQFQRQCPIFSKQASSIQIRDSKLMESLNTWNFEYTTYISANGMAVKSNVFGGVMNEYGNGYAYLSDVRDRGQFGYSQETMKYSNAKIGQFSAYDIYSLKDLKYLSAQTIYDLNEVKDIDNDGSGALSPDGGAYFRTLLYDLKWEYPDRSDKSQIMPYRILSSFDDFVLKSNSTNSYITKCKTYLDGLSKSMPYSILYNVAPRIACNFSNQTINCLMLRCPSIQFDNDFLNNSTDRNYKLNKRYYVTATTPTSIPTPYKR